MCTAVDTYSGLMIAFPCASATQWSTLRTLEVIIQYYGMPLQIQTDNGSHFTGKEVKEFASQNNIEWVYHMPYYPQAAGLIERMNGLLKGALKKMTKDGGFGQWRDNLSEALRTLNNRPLTESTTPLMRMLTPNLTIGKVSVEAIEYWKIEEGAETPYRGTSRSAGLDVHSLEVVVIPGGGTKLLSTGIGVKIPPGHYGQLATRSSYALKNLVVLGGVIDEDYQGEIKVVLVNLGKTDTVVAKGDRIAQLILIPIYVAQVKEIQAPTELTVRGQKGFGSTNEISVGAKIWIQNTTGPPSPAEVIAVGKDRTLLVMRPGVEKWEYIPQEKCYLREIDPGQVKRLPSTCERVGQHAQKTELSFGISFPPAKKCKYRRAWYNTLLGGYGTLTGTLNGFDIETLANRLHNAGSKINDALTLQARWMPTVWAPLKLQAKIDDDLLDIINASNIFTYNVDTNISRVVNWTICSLQTLQQQQQKGLFQTMLMTGNEEVWRTVFSSLVRTEHWLDIKAPKVMCNDTYCKGRLTLYNVTKSSIMCKYVVLPLLIGPKGDQHFWVPTFNGQVIDNDNRTHDLTFCDDTLEGKICKLQSAVYEPCLLQNTVNKCEWTIMPTSYRWMVEIAPQVICVVTDRPVVPKMRVPFAGCIHNITVLQWENETFMLMPDVLMTYRTHWESTRMDVPTWDLNLTKLHRLIEESQQVKDSIKHLNRSIIARQLSTTIVAGQIIKVGSAIADATSHHWWDVFMGYSPSAGTMMNWLVHPLLIVMAIVVILSIWNCYVAYGICCKKKKVVMVSYANGRH
ncbi:uncharacterized protein ACMZJ9_003402 [Mantella aurantiaca]